MAGSLGRQGLAAVAVVLSGGVAAQGPLTAASAARASSACKQASAPGPSASGVRPAPTPWQITVNCPVVQETGDRLQPAPTPAPPPPTASAATAASAAPAPLRQPRASEEFALIVAALLALVMAGMGLVALQRAFFPGSTLLGARRASIETKWPTPEGDFSFRRHWGSLGGESTGWTVTPRLVRLLGGAVLVLSGTALLSQLLPPREGIAGAAPAAAASAPASAPSSASKAG